MDSLAIALIVIIIVSLFIPVIIYALCFCCACRVVPKQKVMILERWGKFHKVAGEGFHCLIPCVDKPLKIRWRQTIPAIGNTTKYNEYYTPFLDLREQLYEFPLHFMITRDNVSISIQPIMMYFVQDPVRAAYEIYDVNQSIKLLVQTTLRALIGDMGLDDTLASREELNAEILRRISPVCEQWGICVTSVEILEITPIREVQNVMHDQIVSERSRRAEVVTAQGYREKQKYLGQGQSKAASIIADGEQRVKEIEARTSAEAKREMMRARVHSLRILDSVLRPLGRNSADFIIGRTYLESFGKILSRASRINVKMPIQTDIVGSARICLDGPHLKNEPKKPSIQYGKK